MRVIAGTARSLGIEALSRGAEKAYFVDTDKTAIGCIEYNLKHTKMFDKSMVLKSDAISALSYNIREAADIIFADPPYGQGFDEQVLAAAARSKAVTEDTLIIIFPMRKTLGLTLSKKKCISRISMYFCEKKANQDRRKGGRAHEKGIVSREF